MENTLEGILFYGMAALTLFGAIFFLRSSNIIHAILYFLISLLGVAGLFLILKAPFIALTQVLVYGGAITVLILFVVMLTISDVPEMVIMKTNKIVAFVLSALLFMLISFIVGQSGFAQRREVYQGNETLTSSFGEVLFKDYLLPFEIAAILLLAALVAAIYLAIGGPDEKVKDEL